MSENVPESFEVVAHFVKRLLKACAQAPFSESVTSEYLDMLDDVVTNNERLRSVTELIGRDIFSILSSMKVEDDTKYKAIVLNFDHEPSVAESMLADWLTAISEDDPDEFFGLIDLLTKEDSATILSFMMLLMLFYTNFIKQNT